jgi:hypothetical protein
LDTYHVVLYIHLMALFVGIGAGAVLLVCLFQLRAAQTLADALPWGMVAGKTEKAFPIAILGLFASGAYMVSASGYPWTWSTGWIDASIGGLVVLALQGPLVGGRSGHMLKHALQENGPGPLGQKARRMTRYPGLWVTEFANLGIVFGIVWNMTQKPGTGTAIAAIVIGYVVGAALAMQFTRMPAPSGEAAGEPAA